MGRNRILSTNLLRRKERHHRSEVGHHGKVQVGHCGFECSPFDGSGFGWVKSVAKTSKVVGFTLNTGVGVVVSGSGGSLVGAML